MPKLAEKKLLTAEEKVLLDAKKQARRVKAQLPLRDLLDLTGSCYGVQPTVAVTHPVWLLARRRVRELQSAIRHTLAVAGTIVGQLIEP